MPPTLWLVLALYAASFLVRAAYLVFGTGVDAPLTGDEPDYHGIAASFLDGNGWVDPGGNLSYRPPLVPLQLVGVYIVTGPEPAAARWTMVAVASLTAPVLFLVARRLLHGRDGVALLAAAAWVLYPPAIWYATLVLTESMAALLVLAGLGTFLYAATARSAWPAALTGALWALAALNRPTFMLLPLALLVVQIVLRRTGASAWNWSGLQWAIGLASFALVMAPWTIRNYVEQGVFMPGTSGLGWLMLISNGTLSDPRVQAGGYYKDPELVRVRDDGASEVERDAIGRRLAFEGIRRNWRSLPRPLVNRAINFWTPRPDPYDPSWTRNDWIMLAVWGPVLMMFLASSFLRSWRESWPVLVVVLYAFLLTLPFWGTPRFRFPVDALIITVACVGLVDTLPALSRLRRRIWPAASR